LSSSNGINMFNGSVSNDIRLQHAPIVRYVAQLSYDSGAFNNVAYRT